MEESTRGGARGQGLTRTPPSDLRGRWMEHCGPTGATVVPSRAGPARQPGWALRQPQSVPTQMQAAHVPVKPLQWLHTAVWHRN